MVRRTYLNAQLEAEALHLAREWLDKSREARQDVSERMVKEWEKNRQKKLTGNSATKEGCGVSLYHSYKTFVEQWQQLRRQTLAEGGGEGAVDLKSSSMGLEAISSSIGDSRLAGMGAGGGNAATNDKPPGFNEWMEKFVDPPKARGKSGERRRKCRADVLKKKCDELLASDQLPLLHVPAEDAPKDGMGEVGRRVQEEGELAGREVIDFEPYTLTKMLIGQFLDECLKVLGDGNGAGARRSMRDAGGGFLKWLEARAEKREDNLAKCKDWNRRKSKIAAARKSTENMQAVLCLDAGGIENAMESNAAPTLETHLRSLVKMEEQTAGVEHYVGSGAPEDDHGASVLPIKAFFRAVEQEDLEKLEGQLKTHGADLANAVNREGLSALDMAVSRKKAGAARLLRGKGSRGGDESTATCLPTFRTLLTFIK